MEYFSTGGINWTWYVGCILHDAGTATVLAHDRMHNQRDYPHPTDAGMCRVVEDKDRTFIALQVCRPGSAVQTYRVANPQYVFAYDKL